MSELPWMLLRLGLETGVHHPLADAARLAALESRTVDDYRGFLIDVYGFEQAVERALACSGLDETMLRERRKMHLLRSDLERLGMTAGAIAALPLSTVRIRSIAHALGWLFVIERHTLLSGLIKRHVQHTLPALDAAVGYLGAYGEAPGARFRLLGTQLGLQARRYPPAIIVAGANEAFRAQLLWYRSRRAEARLAS